jgi:hypothetical protein
MTSKMERSDAYMFEQIRPKQKADLTYFVFSLAEFSQFNHSQTEKRVKEEI